MQVELLSTVSMSPHREHMRLKAFDIETDAYALTRSGLDLVIRGMMRSLSTDHVNCHSCMSAYDSVYFAVLALEQIYEQW